MTVVASNFARKKNELYETEPWATEALLRHFPVKDYWVWEPAAGNWKMARVLRKHCDKAVMATDIATYNVFHDEEYDFLSDAPAPSWWRNEHTEGDEWAIVTNPPYGKGNRDAVRFAERALELNPDGMVALLLTAKFDFGKTRAHLFRNNPRFYAKINLVDRIQWFSGATTGTEDHAWYVWMGRACGFPTLLYEGREPA